MMNAEAPALNSPAPRARAGRGSVEILEVSKRYGTDVPAITGISLHVRSGDFVALLGPSGSGKTTLLNTVAGFLQPDSGSIKIDGREMSGVPPYERGLGVVVQNYALFPHMTVTENVAFPLEVRHVPRARIREEVRGALGLVGLLEFAQRRPKQLSGGQQQRVALARALVYKPPILLLDEPLGALDRRMRDQMQAELKDLHTKLGITFLYVTHDQEEALSLADSVAIMRSGAIEQIGSPQEVYDHPATEFVANFVGDCNIWRGGIEPTTGSMGRVIHSDTGSVLHVGPVDNLSPGQAAVAVRPEWIWVSEGSLAPHDTAKVGATVVQERYRGSESMLECESALGRIQVRLGNVNRSRYKVGAQLVLCWSPEKTVLLKA